MVDFRKSVLHAHKEEVEEDVVDDDDDDDLDNENSLRSIEAKLDRALSDVSHLTVDNLSNSLSQSLGKVLSLLEACFDLISGSSLSMKIQIMGG